MRSFLFVPGDSEKKTTKALQSSADAIIIDWEDSVSRDIKIEAREITKTALSDHSLIDRPAIFVRVNPNDTEWHIGDVERAVILPIAGVVLPKTNGPDDIVKLDKLLSDFEQTIGDISKPLDIFAIATETPKSVFNLGNYENASPRLKWMAWGAEDLAAEIGAIQNRHSDNSYRSPFQLARDLCLIGARAADIEPIDTVFVDLKDPNGFENECIQANADGFTGKMLIHPVQIETANRVFSPTEEQLENAKEIIAYFENNPNSGVVNIGGKMIDQPHLKMAKAMVKRAGKD